jgi:hypothetical protein
MTVINSELYRLKTRLQLLASIIRNKRDVSLDFVRSIDLNQSGESKADGGIMSDQTDWAHGWHTANLSLCLLFLRLIARKDPTEVSELDGLEDQMCTLTLIIKEKCDYSFDLVWYASRRPEDFELAIVRAEVERKYPDHVRSFENNPDWTHGWNSAHLALSRLLLAIINADEEVHKMNEMDQMDGEEHHLYTVDDYIRDQIEEYPCLDS